MNKTLIARISAAFGVAAALSLGGAAVAPAAHAEATPADPAVSKPLSTGVLAQRVGPACLFFQYTFNMSPTDPQVGDTVTYTMQFLNNGEVDSTKSALAFRLDGLLDDSTWAASTLEATSGRPSVAENTVTWNGPLDAGDDVVLRFTGVWTGKGDGLAFPRVESYGYVR